MSKAGAGDGNCPSLLVMVFQQRKIVRIDTKLEKVASVFFLIL